MVNGYGLWRWSRQPTLRFHAPTRCTCGPPCPADALADGNGHAGGAGDGGEGALLDSDALNAMTITAMRDWLTQANAIDAVWTLNNRKPAAKRADWQELVRRVMAGGGGGAP